MENYNLTADQYADMFSDFYAENEATYGEDMEKAYADFEEALNAQVEAEQFEAYYSETQDIYGDNLEEAYADFQAFSNDDEDEDEEEYDEEEYDEEDEDLEYEDEDEDEEYDEEEYDEDEDDEDYEDEDELEDEDEDEEYEEDEDDDYSEEDKAFLDFYSNTQDIYGDNLEEAYADFVEFTTEENEEENIADAYSSEDFDNDFMDFYSKAEDLYEGNIEEAFSDFSELLDSEYGIKDVASKIGKSLRKGASKGFDKTQKFIHKYIAEPGATRHALHHGSYSDDKEGTEDEYGLKEVGKKIAASWKRGNDKFDKWIDRSHEKHKKMGLTTPNGKAQYADESDVEEEVFSEVDFMTMEEYSDGFANFYSDNEELYGDSDEDMEEAYDDYADMIADQELELMFSEVEDEESEVEEKEYSFSDKAKGFASKISGKAKDLAGNKYAKGAAIGTGAGLAAGLIAGSVGKDAKERRALKAKGAGRSAEETARYNELRKGRRMKIAGAALAGGALGAASGNDKVRGAVSKGASKVADVSKAGYAKVAAKFGKKDTNNSAEGSTEDKTFSAEENKAEEPKVEVAKEKSFSAVNLLGTPGMFNLGSIKSTASEDKTFSGKDKSDVKISTNILGILGK